MRLEHPEGGSSFLRQHIGGCAASLSRWLCHSHKQREARVVMMNWMLRRRCSLSSVRASGSAIGPLSPPNRHWPRNLLPRQHQERRSPRRRSKTAR